jgi:tetratricopeptide (TPR) repeat protein
VSDHCSSCLRRLTSREAQPQPEVFWQVESIRLALEAHHFGHLLGAYRNVLSPRISQAALGRWLGMTQAQISRLEAPGARPPSDLHKLERWAAALYVPPALLWFGVSHTSGESDTRPATANLEDVHRRDLLRIAGAALVSSTGVLNDPPWKRQAEMRAGQRPADRYAVAKAEEKTRDFFTSEETLPARLTSAISDDALRRRLISTVGETDALTGWTLFDLGRTREAVRTYRDALGAARAADDRPLIACVLGYWSYLLSSQGDTAAAARMLADAADQVRGTDPATHAWILARRAEEEAASGDVSAAMRALDQAVTVFDYAPNGPSRPWTSFFTENRLGSLAVSTYGRVNHHETDSAAADLLGSLTPSETKVRALVLADLATSAARSGDYDRVQTLTEESAPLATRTEASLAIDRLWEVVELLPEQRTGTAGQTRVQLTEQLLVKPSV